MQISQSIRQLTYLELCVVPAFIEPFLNRLTPIELKATYFLFMQTFFEHNSDNSRINGFGQSMSILRESSKRPLGQSMIYLLKKTLLFYINKDYPLHTFFLEFDSNTEPLMINLQKALLNQISIDGKNQPIINVILVALDLSLELFQIKRGNSKFLFTNGKNQSFELQMQSQALRRKKYMQMLSQVQALQCHQNLSQNIRQFCFYCSNLGSKYEFVVLSKVQKQSKKQSQKQFQLLIQQQVQQAIKNADLEIHSTQYWLFTSPHDSCQMIINSYVNLVKNFSQQATTTIHKLNNCALLLINRLTQTRSEPQMQIRISIYSLIVGLKVLSGLKQRYINIDELVQTSQSYFKQIMQLQTCRIDTTFYFLIAFLQLDIEVEAFYNRIINLIGWVMGQYRKYSFKSQELIYADFIASNLDLLVSWKQSLKQDEEEKQVENVILRLAAKTKTHGQKYFALFFQTLNPKLLNYVSICLIKAQSFQIPKNNQMSQICSLALVNFEQDLNGYLCSLTFSRMKEKSKQLQGAETTLLYVYFIIYKNQPKKQVLICMRLYQLIKMILQKNKKKYHQDAIQMLARQCLSQCLTNLLHSINTVLLEYNVSSSKKNQTNLNVGISNVNAQSKKAGVFIQQSFRILIFINLVLFGINPKQNKMSFVFALVFDSHSLKQSMTEFMIQLYEKANKVGRINWLGNESQILKYSRRYDTLEIFYEEVLKKIEASQSQKESQILAFQNFCRNWCLEEINYQWLSDQKASRIRLLQLKKFCLKLQEGYKL